MENKETITISKKEYDKLKKDSNLLGWLKGTGVDNWEGYSGACGMMEKNNENMD